MCRGTHGCPPQACPDLRAGFAFLSRAPGPLPDHPPLPHSSSLLPYMQPFPPTGCFYKKDNNLFDPSCSTQPDVCGAIQDPTQVVECCDWKKQVQNAGSHFHSIFGFTVCISATELAIQTPRSQPGTEGKAVMGKEKEGRGGSGCEFCSCGSCSVDGQLTLPCGFLPCSWHAAPGAAVRCLTSSVPCPSSPSKQKGIPDDSCPGNSPPSPSPSPSPDIDTSSIANNNNNPSAAADCSTVKPRNLDQCCAVSAQGAVML